MAERRRFASQAEYYRHHRQVFLLAQELGCTPNQAEAEMRRIQQHERQRAAEQRREQLRLPMTPLPHLAGHPSTLALRFDDWDAPWMSRD